MVYLSLPVFILELPLFALHLFEYHYSFSPLSLLSYHLSASAVNMSPLLSILPPLIFSQPIPSSPSPPFSFLSAALKSSQPPPLIKGVVQRGRNGSPRSLSSSEAVRERVLSLHPSPLAGQGSDRHAPPPHHLVSCFTA